MQIEIEVTGQKIKRLNSPGSVADTLNYLTCHFIFVGEEWDNTVRTAYFNNPKSGERYAQIIADDGTCTVPWEALTDKGFVRFSVAGEREDYRITTDIESFYNGETVYGGEPSEPPTPSQYDQLIALAEQTKEIAESVRRDADEGKFDGEPGKQGNPGRDGVSPTAKVEQTDDGAVITITDAAGTTAAELKNGKEGKPGQNATDEQVRSAVDAYMADHPVQVDAEDIIKLAIKNEASGAVPIAVTDSADMGVQDLEMQGWTEQPQYEGKNLLEIPDITAEIIETKIECNITQPITISATNEVTVSTKIWRFRAKYKDGTYVHALDMDSSFVKTFDASEENPIIEITYRGTYITSGAYRNVQIEYGESATAYEPYTGGKPSPSPDYPQKIVSAGKYNEDTQKYEYQVKLTGKNMLPRYDSPSDWMPGGYFYIPIHGFIVGETYTASQQNPPEVGENFYVSIGTYAGNANVGVQHWLYHKNGGYLTKKSVSFKATQEVYYLNVADISSNGVTIDSAKLDKFLELFPDLMLEIGSEPTEYTPYQEQAVTLTADRPLTKWDKLEKRNGQWGWVYKSAEIVLDGTESYAVGSRDYASDFSSNCYTLISNMVRNGRTNAFMNRLSNIDYSWTQTDAIGFSKNFNQLHVRISNSDLGTTGESSASEVTDATKAYMAQQYEDGNPFIALYETAEETFVPLSESEQEALNALTTYYPTTVLDNDQGCEMSAQYIADTKAYIDKKISAIQAAIVNTI